MGVYEGGEDLYFLIDSCDVEGRGELVPHQILTSQPKGKGENVIQ